MPNHHTCYFHKQNPITNFCTRSQCTLPMCSECLPIHTQQHQDDNKNKGVVTFVQAQHQAISSYKNIISSQTKLKSQCHFKIQQCKQDVLRMVDLLFSNMKVKIDKQYLNIAEIERKLGKLQKGSLKTLIYFYSEPLIKFNDDYKAQLFCRIQNFERIIKQTAQQLKNWQISQDNNKGKDNTNKMSQRYMQQQHKKQRKQSFDNHFSNINHLSKKSLNTKSFTNIQYNQINANQHQHKNNQPYINIPPLLIKQTQPYKKLNSDRSMKLINRCQIQSKQAVQRNTKRQYKYEEEENKYNAYSHQNHQADMERLREIEKIKQRQTQHQKQKEIEKERQRQRERQREIERMQQRERERQMEKQREKQKQRQRQRERQIQRSLEKQKQLQKQRKSQVEKLRSKQSLFSGQQYKKQTQNYSYQNNTNTYTFTSDSNRYQTRNYDLGSMGSIGSLNTRKYELTTNNQYLNLDQYKRPLQVADLNIQSKGLLTGQTNRVARSFTFNKQLETKSLSSGNNLELNKQVMSPEQIRKMLQKRIQQRSRLLSKNNNQSYTPPKKTQSIQYKASTILSKSKQNVNSQIGYDGQARWNTKDSIINQIYQDYRY